MCRKSEGSVPSMIFGAALAPGPFAFAIDDLRVR